MMSRTVRYDNGLNKGRDDKPMEGHHGSDSSHPKGYNTFDDDHGGYNASARKKMKSDSSRARRIYFKKIDSNEQL